MYFSEILLITAHLHVEDLPGLDMLPGQLAVFPAGLLHSHALRGAGLSGERRRWPLRG